MTDASVVPRHAIVEVETRATCMSRVAGYQLKMIIAAWLRLTLYSIEHVIGRGIRVCTRRGCYLYNRADISKA